jgi:PAS domain S-box-containing protein
MKKTRKRETFIIQLGSQWIEATADPMFDSEENLIGAVHIMADVTERKQLEDAHIAAVVRAEDEKAKSDSIIAAIGDGISIHDRNFNILYQNQSMKAMIGDHVGEPCYRAYEKKDQTCEGCCVARVFEDGGTHIVERSAQTDNGTLYVEITASPLRDSTGKIIAAIEVVHNITERKKAEEALRISEERHRLIFQGSPVGIFHYDAGLIITDTNDRFVEILKSTREKLVGLDMSTLRDRRVLPSLEAVLAGKEGWYEGEYKATAGSAELIVSMRTAPLFGRDGTVTGGVGIVEDVTERKRAEEAVVQQKLFTESLIRNSAIATFVLDSRHRVLIWNKACEELTGSPASAMIGTSLQWKSFYSIERPVLADLVLDGAPDMLQDLYPEHSKSVLMPEGVHVERWLRNLNGKDKYVVFDAAPIRDTAGNIIAAVETLQDFTGRKILEEQVFRAKQDWEYTFDSITDMVTVHDEEYNIILANKAAEKILGLPFLDKTKGAKCFRYYHGADHAPAGCPSCSCLQTAKSADFEIFEPHLNMFIEIRAIPRFDSDNKLIGLIHVVRDITERKNFERQLKMHTERLEVLVSERTRELEDANYELQTVNKEVELRREEAEAASRSKTDFLATMSHELRTPLNAIMGFSDIMLMGMAGPISEKQKEFLNDISASGNHLLTLINDILDLSKVEAGKIELELTTFHLRDLIEGALMMFKEKGLKHGIRVETSIDETLSDITADWRKMKQIMVNLLSNAFKFTLDGGSVSVATRRVRSAEQQQEGLNSELRTQCSELDAECIEISVADTGIGISTEHQKRLFQPFQQIETSLTRKYAGTGLGLSLCRRFVELHGGTLWVESEEGKGSTFTFIIPLRDNSGART